MRPSDGQKSSGNRSGSSQPQQSNGSKSARSQMSFDALGRGLTGRSEPTQSSHVRSGMDGASEDDIEFSCIGSLPGADEGGIQVTTVVEQDVEKIGGSDSTRSLVRPLRSESGNSSR